MKVGGRCRWIWGSFCFGCVLLRCVIAEQFIRSSFSPTSMTSISPLLHGFFFQFTCFCSTNLTVSRLLVISVSLSLPRDALTVRESKLHKIRKIWEVSYGIEPKGEKQAHPGKGKEAVSCNMGIIMQSGEANPSSIAVPNKRSIMGDVNVWAALYLEGVKKNQRVQLFNA